MTTTTAEGLSHLRAVVIEDTDSKFELIKIWLRSAKVQHIGRLATMQAVLAELDSYTPDGPGKLAEANTFFVDGNLSGARKDGSDGAKIIKTLVAKQIAYPAAYLAEHRERYPDQISGVVFGCSADPGHGEYADAVAGHNFNAGMPGAAIELAHMVSMAVELLPAATQTAS